MKAEVCEDMCTARIYVGIVCSAEAAHDMVLSME